MNPDPGADAPSSRALGLRAGMISTGLFLLIALPLILTGFHEGRASWDSRHYHEPAIRLFAEQLPRPDLTDYASATTPGYHLLMALPVRVGIESGMALRLMSCGITAVFVFLFASQLAGRSKSLALGVLFTLPLLTSNYTLLPGVFVLPDNLAWLLLYAVILRCLDGKVSARSLVITGAILAGLVFTRQIHLWVSALIWITAWMHTDPHVERPIWSNARARMPRTLLAVACTLPAFLIVGYFDRMWGGLTPPRFQTNIERISTSLPAFLLLEIAILTFFVLTWLHPVLWRIRWSSRVFWTILGTMGVGLVLAVVPETTWSFDEGRASGWWNVVRKLPVIADRTSPVLLLGAPAGAVAILWWGAWLGSRERWIFGITLLAFTASQIASANVWQRYHEPLLLMLLGLAVASIASRTRHELGLGAFPRRLGFVLLAAVLSMFTVRAIYQGDRDPNKAAPTVFGVIQPEPDSSEPTPTTTENPADPAPPTDTDP